MSRTRFEGTTEMGKLWSASPTARRSGADFLYAVRIPFGVDWGCKIAPPPPSLVGLIGSGPLPLAESIREGVEKVHVGVGGVASQEVFRCSVRQFEKFRNLRSRLGTRGSRGFLARTRSAKVRRWSRKTTAVIAASIACNFPHFRHALPLNV